MKEIKLTKGKVTLVDDEDYEYLNQFKWYAHNGHSKRSTTEKYYVARRLCSYGTLIFMHHIIITVPEGKEIDHIDGDGLNNQKYNLRICTHKENMNNIKLSKRGRERIYIDKEKIRRKHITKELIEYANRIINR